MIRDPSDGSVREPQKSDPVVNRSLPALKPARTGESDPAVTLDCTGSDTDTVIDHTTSGLQTGNQSPKNIAKLEKSREWLRDYRAGKINLKSPSTENEDG